MEGSGRDTRQSNVQRIRALPPPLPSKGLMDRARLFGQPESDGDHRRGNLLHAPLRGE